jgi:YhcH/YjgK/YiaL family protein
MIVDRLENASLYRPLGSRIAQALDYLAATDFTKVSDGRHPLDADRLFAMVSRYRPKPPAEIVWEAHRQFIDVQYVVEGVERMGYAPLTDDSSVRQVYNPQKDFALYDVEGDFFAVRAGTFVIFTPHDVHAPGLTDDPHRLPGNVCKVVVKCRVD